MDEPNEKEAFEPSARPASRRIAFCPACGRPFLRGMGFWQPGCAPSNGKNGNRSSREETDCAEYCSEACLPGLPA